MHAQPVDAISFQHEELASLSTIIFCCNSHTSCSYYGGSRESDDEQLEDQ